MKTLILVLFGAVGLNAQGFGEVRAADTKYRYADFAYTFNNRMMLEVFYFGIPGANDLNVGAGYLVKPSSRISLTPALYAVKTKEGEAGLKLGLTFSASNKNWKLNSFVAKHWSVKNFSSYSFADPIELTKVIDRLEFGVSAGFTHLDHQWNPLIGPVVKFNDKVGNWSLSVRGGSARELRFGRTFNF